MNLHLPQTSPPHSFRMTQSDFVLELSRKKVKVILSVPHDGSSRYEYAHLFRERGDDVTTVRDLNTWEIARSIFLQTSVTSLVRGLLPRTVIDYNRHIDGREYQFYTREDTKIEPAYRDERVGVSYMRFHMVIADLLSGARDYANHPLLLDIHGFSTQPGYAPEGGYDIILGTGNRRTLQWRSTIDQRFARFLTKRGYRVFLPGPIPICPEKDDAFDAGHITRHHSRESYVDAIQVEISRRFRNLEERSELERLAADMSEWIREEFGNE